MIFDEETDTAVLDMVSAIVHEAKILKPSVEVDVNLDMCLDSSEQYTANQACLISDLGTIAVFPCFRNKMAYAYIVNKGIIHNMQSEGFDDEFIQTHGKIYSDPIAFSKDTVHLLGYYLTQKI
jgi:hypothetical protein